MEDDEAAMMRYDRIILVRGRRASTGSGCLVWVACGSGTTKGLSACVLMQRGFLDVYEMIGVNCNGLCGVHCKGFILVGDAEFEGRTTNRRREDEAWVLYHS